jgi:hypothetical protein
MSDMNTATIYAAARQRDLDMPAAVTAAEELVTAARTMHEEITNETRPDLTTLTAKTLRKAHAAMVAFENRDARLRAADQIVASAQQSLDNAEFVSAGQLTETFAKRFAESAGTFVTAYAALDGNLDVARIAIDATLAEQYGSLRAAADELDQLRDVRAAYSPVGSRADTVSDIFEEASRCCRVADSQAIHRSPVRGRGIEYWGRLVDLGFELRWQSNAEQEENSATVARRPSWLATPAGGRLPNTCSTGTAGEESTQSVRFKGSPCPLHAGTPGAR